MNQKGFPNALAIILAVIIVIGIVGYFRFFSKQEIEHAIISVSEAPLLSADKKSIVSGDKILLSIDNDSIFNWFKTESQLCNEHNLTSSPNRKIFCEDKTFFKNLTRFVSVVISPDRMKIGFTIESDILPPDKVVGIFLRSTETVHLLSDYYLGNEFISFSPNSLSFVYQGGCFEIMCALYVKNSETLISQASLSDAEYADARIRAVTFIRWLSDNEIEYKLGTELKQASF